MILQIAQAGLIPLACIALIDAWRTRKIPILVFIALDAYLFECLLLWHYHEVAYNSSLISAGGIPLMIMVGWAILLFAHMRFYSAQSIWVKAALIAVSMTFIDLVMDAAMVRAGFWIWNQPAGYFGIPYENLFAWLLYSFLVVLFASAALDAQGKRRLNMLGGAFLSITVIGLAVGVLWRQIPISLQYPLFWLLLIGCTSMVIGKFHTITIEKKSIAYLPVIPLAFFAISFSLILIFGGFPIGYAMLSCVWFALWLAPILWLWPRDTHFFTVKRSTSA